MNFVQLQHDYHLILEDKGTEECIKLTNKINSDINKIIRDFEHDPVTYHFLLHLEGDQNDYQKEYLIQKQDAKKRFMTKNEQENSI